MPDDNISVTTSDDPQHPAAAPSSPGASGTAQRYSVHVPFGDVSLQLGASAAGAGASLSTIGDVFIDSVGVGDYQSKGAFLAQTNAAMTLLSGASSHVHSQGKVEVFAGGGMAPGPCGGGGPAAPADTGTPGAAAEAVTNVACNALSGVKAWKDLSSAVTAAQAPTESVMAGFGAAAGVMKGMSDLTKAALGPTALAEKNMSKVGSGFEAASGVLGVVAGVAKGDVGSVVSGLSNVITGASGAAGGGADIKENATGFIKMVAGKKISGVAPFGIDSKTPAKYEVKALAVVDFATIAFSNFVLAKFEVKCIDKVATTSNTFDHAVKATVKIDCGKSFTGQAPKISQDGKVHVTKTVDVGGNTSFKAKLKVKKNTTMKDALTVKGAVTVNGKIEVFRDVTVKGTATAGAKVTTQDKVIKGRVTFM
ncbi:MAG: hypothetical protein R3A52_10150 [Polyangiales bacterium]